MNKIVEYKVVTGRLQDQKYYDSLDSVVNDAIQNGWQPIGGVTTNSGTNFFQAMVRYESPPTGLAARIAEIRSNR